MINKANDIYNRWLIGQEGSVINHAEELEARAKPEPLSGSASTNSPVTHFSQYPLLSSPPQPQTLLVADPFARAHSSLAQCMHDMHGPTTATFPHASQNHCRYSSVAVNRNDPALCSWNPPPRVDSVDSPVLTEVMREIDFSKENGCSSGYEAISSPLKGTTPAVRAYFHVTPNSGLSYGGHEIYGHHMYSRSSLPQDGLSEHSGSSVAYSTSTSNFGGVDPMTFELGVLSTNSDQNWMGFF